MSIEDTYKTRPLTADDWQIFSTLRLEAIRDYPKAFFSTYAQESKRGEREWRTYMAPKEGCFFGTFKDDVLVGIIGVVTMLGERNCGIIVSNYVKQDYQQQGLSTKLYAEAIAWAKHYLPWKELVVKYREGNEASRHTIEKANFIFDHQKASKWPDGGNENEYVYKMDLETLRTPQQHPTATSISLDRN